MQKVLRYSVAAVIVALVVDMIDNVSPRAAIGLSAIIVLLILMVNQDVLASYVGR